MHAWPHAHGVPLAFVAQFNLQEVTQHEAAAALPDDGMLFFFCRYHPEAVMEGNEWRSTVLHGPVRSADASPLAMPDLDRRLRVPDYALSFVEEWTLPTIHSQRYADAGLGHIHRNSLPRPEEGEWGADGPFFRMFGHADDIQEEMEWEFSGVENLPQILHTLGNIRGLAELKDIDGFRELLAGGQGIAPLNDPEMLRRLREKAAKVLGPDKLAAIAEEAMAALRSVSKPKPARFDPDDWQLLFQMDSLVDGEHGVDLSWASQGRVYFWIDRGDLAKHSFDCTNLIAQFA
ncbi:MAG: DUF1963 domain-containing protein [Proteobacteria bacterium]|nr:DUF1963 domain-containing protein [Pseudomonadota bacterium]